MSFFFGLRNRKETTKHRQELLTVAGRLLTASDSLVGELEHCSVCFMIS